MIVLRFLSLPLLIALGIFTGIIGMSKYWFYYTFKKEQLYKLYGQDN